MSQSFRIMMLSIITVVGVFIAFVFFMPSDKQVATQQVAAAAEKTPSQPMISAFAKRVEWKEKPNNGGQLITLFEKQCPALVSQWQSDLEYIKADVRTTYPFLQEKEWADHMVELEIKVAENASRIPASFRANGHICQFAVDGAGSAISVAKSSCAQLCELTGKDGYRQITQPVNQAAIRQGYAGFDKLYIKRSMRDFLSISFNQWQVDSDANSDFVRIDKVVFAITDTAASVTAAAANQDEALRAMLSCYALGVAALNPETDAQTDMITHKVQQAITSKRKQSLKANKQIYTVEAATRNGMDLLICDINEER